MATSFITAFLALSSFSSISVTTAEQVWGAVAFVVHGEFTPYLVSTTQTLTPLGANQAYEAGSVLRTRLIDASPASNVTTSSTIEGVSSTDLDNAVVSVLSTDDQYVSGSAMAFLQGLYPPMGLSSGQDEQELTNGSYMFYPMNNYQYPNIQTFSMNDYDSIWLEGSENCFEYIVSSLQYTSSQQYGEMVSSTYDFYQSLPEGLFEGVQQGQLNFQQALALYQYADFQYTHNRTLFPDISASDIQQLHSLASYDQFSRYGNLTARSPKGASKIRTIGGQTLAGEIYTSLRQNVMLDGASSKLTLMFGSFEPLISFFALSGLASTNEAWRGIPKYGSTMLFELFSNDDATNGTFYPDTDDLWVRFSFRNGTDESMAFLSYPLFNRGNSASDMAWADFSQLFDGIMINSPTDWCNTCQGVSIFCTAFESNSNGSSSGSNSSKSSSSSLSPAIGGVIGALVTIAVLLLALLIAMLLFGLRFTRKPYGQHRGSLGTLGGFKGAEKLGSDLDVSQKGVGASIIRHERVGSWELRERPDRLSGATQAGQGEQSLDGAVANVQRKEDDEDAISIVNPFGEPVRVEDRV